MSLTSVIVTEVKSKAKALRHFKVDPILKIDAIFPTNLDLCDIQDQIIYLFRRTAHYMDNCK